MLEIICIWVLMCLGITLNSLTVYVFFSFRKKLSCKDRIIFSMTSCNLLQCICSYPYLIADYQRPRDAPATIQCKIPAFTVTFTAIANIAHITVLSIKFWLAMSQPFWTQKLEEKWYRCLYFIVPCWSYGLMWALFPVFGWSNYGKETEDGYRCGMNFRQHNLNVMTYNIALLFGAFVFPILICLYSYTRIVQLYKSLRRNAKTLCGAKSRLVYETQRQMVQHYIMNAVILAVFVLIWTPYAVLAILNIFKMPVSQGLHNVAAILAKSSTCFNPIIYALMFKEFRGYVRKLWRASLCCTKFKAKRESFTISRTLEKGQNSSDVIDV